MRRGQRCEHDENAVMSRVDNVTPWFTNARHVTERAEAQNERRQRKPPKRSIFENGNPLMVVSSLRCNESEDGPVGLSTVCQQ